MRIGLDIDNVISDFDKSLMNEFLIEDKNKRNNGIIDKNAKYITKDMFDWDKNEIDLFLKNKMESISLTLHVRKDAKKYIDKLLDDGHEIYLISHRKAPHYKKPYKTTLKWLEKNSINFTKLVISDDKDKSKECILYGIDIMFDDLILNCKNINDSGIKCVLMKTQYNNDPNELDIVNSWKELYSFVNTYAYKNLPKVKVILDTDMNNEADDQFALAYLLSSEDRIDLQAVTIAPYFHSDEGKTIKSGIEKSFDVCKKIFELCNMDSKNKIFRGSINYFSNGCFEENEATAEMYNIIMNNDLTYIVCIGAIANIAILIKNHPDIINKTKIVWLGGNSVMHKNNDEYNFRQDKEAVKYVIQSDADITIIPCGGVASNLTTSIFELEHNINVTKGLGKYLYDKFYNDGRHGISTRRVIWDIAAIAYVINPYWFKEQKKSISDINDRMEYIFKKNNKQIIFVYDLDSKQIYDDLFMRLKNF